MAYKRLIFVGAFYLFCCVSVNAQEAQSQVQLAKDQVEGESEKTNNLAPRSSVEIQETIERNKDVLKDIYNSALRLNPSLVGHVMFKLTIAPSGTITQCEIASSDLNDSELESRLIASFQKLNFGQKTVTETAVMYPMIFSPR